MGVAQTSLWAFSDAKKKLGDKQGIVYGDIKENEPTSNEQIAERLGWPINCVTPRVNELAHMNLIACETRLLKNKSGRWVKAWVSKHPYEETLNRRFKNETKKYDADGIRI